MSLTSRRTVMARKRYKPEEIVAKLRQVDVLVSQGQNMVDAIRQIGVSEVTYYRWRQEFGGLKTEQVKRLKDLELENSRLRKAVSDLTLDKLILQGGRPGKLLSPARRRACFKQVRAQLHVSECRAWAGPLDATQAPARSERRAASYCRHHRACPAIRPLWLSQGRRTAAPGGLQTGVSYGRRRANIDFI